VRLAPPLILGAEEAGAFTGALPGIIEAALRAVAVGSGSATGRAEGARG
jgi:hypothetical protein